MNLPVIIAIVSCLFFGFAAIAISIQNDKLKKLAARLERKNKQRIFEVEAVSEISASGQNLDITSLPDLIAAKNNSFLDFTAIAILSIQNGDAVFKARLNGQAGTKYISFIKEKMLLSLQALSQNTITDIRDEAVSGAMVDRGDNSVPGLFFNIPIIISSKIAGILCISSIKKDSIKSEDIAFMYRFVEQISKNASAVNAAREKSSSDLKSVLDTTRDGIIVIDNKDVKLINSKALSLLDVFSNRPALSDVLSGLPSSYNFGDKINQVAVSGNKYEENNVVIKNHSYNFSIHSLKSTAVNGTVDNSSISILISDSEINSNASRMKEDFTNILVHELRSPLTSIKASCEMLNGQGTLTDDERKQLIKIINTQSTKMLDEITVILDAAKIDSGLFTVQKTPGDIRQVINDTIGELSAGAESKFVKVVAEIAPNLPQFAFDRYHIKKALVNLILNSIKFTAGGGSVIIRAWQDNGKVRISIIDSGIGIPKDKQHLLFTKFSQIQDPSARVGKGLGLYVTRGIIEAHGGSIVLDSEPNKGTTVTISIPFTPVINPQMDFERTQTQINPMAN